MTNETQINSAELMNEEQLEQVAGGSLLDSAEDSKFLYEHGLTDDYHGIFAFMFHWKSYSKEIDKGWAKAGITCTSYPAGANAYYLNGKEITPKEAKAIVRAKFKKIREA